MRRPVQLAAAQRVILDCLQGETFFIRLVTSIRDLEIINVSPGQLYVLVLTQDASGGRTVEWAPQALNATAPDPDPHSVSVLTFIGQTGNYLKANVGGAYAGTNATLLQEGKRRWRPRRLAQSPPSK